MGVHVCGCRAHVGSMGHRHAGIAGECWDSLGPGFTLFHYRQGDRMADLGATLHNHCLPGVIGNICINLGQILCASLDKNYDRSIEH